VEELDWSVGQVLDKLRMLNLEERTFVFFSSDNGPWLIMGDQGGSAGPLRDGKGCTWEGGMRVPGIAWMPGRIKPSITSQPASVLDLFPTVMNMAGRNLPEGVVYDGTDLTELLCGNGALPERPFFYYRGTDIFACRLGEWKAHFRTQSGYGQAKPEVHETPLLFHLGRDMGEQRNVASEHPDVISRITEAARIHRETVIPGEPQLR